MKEIEDYISLATREFIRLKNLSDDAVGQISESQFFHKPSKGDNSIAIIYKHMSGNIRSRWTDFLTTDGEKSERQRDSEFTINSSDTHPRLLEKWDEAWSILFDMLSSLEPEDLSRIVTIRGEGLTVLQATCRQMTHYAYHVGQIVYLAKHIAGDDWKTLSIPLGKSEEYNKSPSKYIK